MLGAIDLMMAVCLLILVMNGNYVLAFVFMVGAGIRDLI